MDPSSTWLIVLYVALIFACGYFSASEMAFSSVNKIKIMNFRDTHPKQAEIVLDIMERYDFFLIILLIGTNIVNVACAAVSTIITGRVFMAMQTAGAGATEVWVTTVSTAITTVLIFLFGETIPKTFAKDNTEKVAIAFAPSLRFVSYILYPLSLVFLGLSKLMNKIVAPPTEPTVTEDELSTIIETSEEEGVIDEDQSELLQSALEFSDTRVSDVLTLRDDVVWIDKDADADTVLATLRTTNFSRLPVCAGTLDKPIGVLIVNDALKAMIHGTYKNLSRLMRKPYFTTLDASIDDLKDEMSGKRQHMALVRDKKGKSIIGVVTIEDFLEELVGEIFDETDTVDDNFMKLGGNYFRVVGKLTVAELFRRIGYRPGSLPIGHKLLSTWVMEQLGRIPEVEDSFVFEDLTVTVDETEGNRASVLTVKLADPQIDLDEPTEREGGAD